MSRLRRPLHRKPERATSPPSLSSLAQVPCRFGDLLSEIDHVDAYITVIWDKNARSDARYALACMQQHQIGWAISRWLDEGTADHAGDVAMARRGNGGLRRRYVDDSTRERRITRTMWQWVGGGTGDRRGDCAGALALAAFVEAVDDVAPQTLVGRDGLQAASLVGAPSSGSSSLTLRAGSETRGIELPASLRRRWKMVSMS